MNAIDPQKNSDLRGDSASRMAAPNPKLELETENETMNDTLHVYPEIATIKRGVPSGAPSHDADMMRRSLELLAPQDEDECVEVLLFAKAKPLGSAFINRAGVNRVVDLALEEPFDAAYVRPNPVARTTALEKNPVLNLFFQSESGKCATRADIAKRNWLLVDCDPERPTNTAASDSAHEAALELAGLIRAYLTENGTRGTVLADSGNGAHVLIPLAGLPVDDYHNGLCLDFLKGLHAVFYAKDGNCKVDICTHDAPRLLRWYGTLNSKGPHTLERPHRRSALLDLPEDSAPVTAKKLEAVLDDLRSRATALQVKLSAEKGGDAEGQNKDPKNTLALLEDALSWIDPEPRETWIKVGMGLHSFDPEACLELWEEWSKGPEEKPCPKYEAGACAKAWESFTDRDDGLTVSTLFALATEAGWNRKAAQSRINGSKHSASRNSFENSRLLAQGFIGFCKDNPLRQYQGDWYVFNGASYRCIKNHEAEARVMGYIQSVDANSSKSPARLTSKATRGNLLANLASTEMAYLPSEPEPPFWIRKNGIEPAPGWVALRNLRVNVAELGRALANGNEIPSGLIEPNSPDLFAVRSLPYDFDPNVKCPMWEKYVASALPDQADQDILRRMFALCLVPDTSYGVFFVLAGRPGTGKSVALDVLREVVGASNCCCVPLADMEGKFNGRLMTEALVNVVDDLPTRGSIWDRTGEGALKSFATGGIVPCERKGVTREVGDDRPAIARTVLAANALPHFEDISDGIWQRMRVIPFNEVFRSKNGQVPDLARKIVKDELPGVFAWAASGFSELLNEAVFPESPRGLKLKRVHQRRCNPVLSFLDDTYPDGAPEGPVPVSSLTQRIKNWCEANGEELVQGARLASSLQLIAGAEKKTVRHGKDKKPTKCFVFPAP